MAQDAGVATRFPRLATLIERSARGDLPSAYHALHRLRLLPLQRAFAVIATLSFAAFWWWDRWVYAGSDITSMHAVRLATCVPLALLCGLLFLRAARDWTAWVLRAYVACLFLGLAGVSHRAPAALTWALPAFMALPIVVASMLTRWQDLVSLLAIATLAPMLALAHGRPDAVIVVNYAMYLAVADIGAAILYLATEHVRRRAYRLELALERVAHTDALTGLLSRRRFLELASEHVAHADGGAALLYLDLDHFKQVNDDFGHEAGDDALRAVARALRQSVPPGALVSRLGGEEFVLLLPKHAGGALTEHCDALLARVAEIRVRGRALSTSIGAARQRPGESLASLLTRADGALLQAKRDGRGRAHAANGDASR